MRARHHLVLPAASLLLGIALGCSAESGNTGIVSHATPPQEKKSASEAVVSPDKPAGPLSPSRPPVGDLDPTEEMLIGLPTLPAIREDDASALPEEPGALRKKAKAELAAGRTDEALPIIDVLLVLDPDDAEMLEIRGDIMMKRDLSEDAAVDFRRCCKLGRISCCR